MSEPRSRRFRPAPRASCTRRGEHLLDGQDLRAEIRPVQAISRFDHSITRFRPLWLDMGIVSTTTQARGPVAKLPARSPELIAPPAELGQGREAGAAPGIPHPILQSSRRRAVANGIVHGRKTARSSQVSPGASGRAGAGEGERGRCQFSAGVSPRTKQGSCTNPGAYKIRRWPISLRRHSLVNLPCHRPTLPLRTQGLSTHQPIASLSWPCGPYDRDPAHQPSGIRLPS